MRGRNGERVGGAEVKGQRMGERKDEENGGDPDLKKVAARVQSRVHSLCKGNVSKGHTHPVNSRLVGCSPVGRCEVRGGHVCSDQGESSGPPLTRLPHTPQSTPHTPQSTPHTHPVHPSLPTHTPSPPTHTPVHPTPTPVHFVAESQRSVFPCQPPGPRFARPREVTGLQ
ncbi:hypothetical protein C0Q70_13086 [Pomacea canaliculata]|uniref:Uncharacterized protein n=1 Tax=Pomacea canaliculata TaxID=400727 RepID=A0A2T7NW72_POMCA|nr:hypothetical protein C0Q70_13086 [Pomacea canaliculata]